MIRQNWKQFLKWFFSVHSSKLLSQKPFISASAIHSALKGLYTWLISVHII
ncbi:hypothetical protein Nmel_006524 [Mimus melanotis]